VTSIEPDDSRGEMNSGKEVCCYFVIASYSSPILLKLAEEILDQVSSFIELPIVGALCFIGCFWMESQRFSCFVRASQWPAHACRRLCRQLTVYNDSSQQELQCLADHGLTPELRVKLVELSSALTVA